jgi:hypothetical protein
MAAWRRRSCQKPLSLRIVGSSAKRVLDFRCQYIEMLLFVVADKCGF